MARTDRVTARVEPNVKADAEALFRRCGISMSDAINMFLHRTVLENGIPFSIDGTAKAESSTNRPQA